MKILFIGMPFSIHTVRWLSQIDKNNFELHFFSSFPYSQPHEKLTVTFHDYFYTILKPGNYNIKKSHFLFFNLNKLSPKTKKIFGKVFRFLKLEKTPPARLKILIEKLKPDIVHTLETQHAAYLLNKIWNDLNYKPIWIHSTWGVDFHLFGRLDEHLPKIKQVLIHINVLITEGKRDLQYAYNLGFSKKNYIFPSVGGGFNTTIHTSDYSRPSERKIIMLKGSQDEIRRGLVGLRALERCLDILNEFEIIIYQCDEPMLIAAQLFQKNHQKHISIIKNVSHKKMLELNGKARISITVNISDGLPNSMLEAMLMGAFPIQSNTSMADEWITDGTNGILVYPEDSEEIEKAIRRAVIDDQLVDTAASINFKLISENLEESLIQKKINQMYKETALDKSN